MRTSKVVLGTMAGLAIGAIAGILFAPEKGSTTRKQILDKGKAKFFGAKKDMKNAATSFKQDNAAGF
jgi:gas vesicle protein